MLAREMEQQWAPSKLEGQIINTKEFGDWPGGEAEIIEVNPDGSAPEIVFTVKLVEPAWGVVDKTKWYDDEMGIFEYEEVSFVDPEMDAAANLLVVAL